MLREYAEWAEAFQSTHPLRGATLVLRQLRRFVQISIHAPLAGCDSSRSTVERHTEISIHAPLAGCDQAVKQLTKGE